VPADNKIRLEKNRTFYVFESSGKKKAAFNSNMERED
jgi:hypothetical protein